MIMLCVFLYFYIHFKVGATVEVSALCIHCAVVPIIELSSL